jgi:hypothetical protein
MKTKVYTVSRTYVSDIPYEKSTFYFCYLGVLKGTFFVGWLEPYGAPSSKRVGGLHRESSVDGTRPWAYYGTEQVRGGRGEVLAEDVSSSDVLVWEDVQV